MNIRDLIREEPKGGEIFTDPATPSDKDDFKIQNPEIDPDFTNRIGGDAYKKAMEKFGRSLRMLQSTHEMLQGFGQTGPDMEARIKDLIQTGIKAGYIKGA